MPERKTVGQLMDEMRLKAGAQNYHGHEYMDLQRFAEDTRHMIIFDQRVICKPRVPFCGPHSVPILRDFQIRTNRKTTASGALVMVKSVHRTRSRRMKFCVYGGLGDTLNKQRLEPNGYPGALLAAFYTKHIYLHHISSA